MATLNEVFSKLSARRRYEVWFLRMGLADGSGACWFRYLMLNPGRGGCEATSRGKPIQIWATWFPASGKPQSLIEGFPLDQLDLSSRGQAPFHFRVRDNAMAEDSCRGALDVGGHQMTWDLRYQSTFSATLSSVGWIGFSRTPHSDARFSGKVTFDGKTFVGDPLGFGVQGHNCGYRHRNFWSWAHAYFPQSKGATTLEALTYEMPLGLVFRRAILRHDGRQYIFRNLKEIPQRERMVWDFRCSTRNGMSFRATIDGRGQSILQLPYTKTNCSGALEIANNSLASASLELTNVRGAMEKLETTCAVLEVAG